jgi:hypothetical protein
MAAMGLLAAFGTAPATGFTTPGVTLIARFEGFRGSAFSQFRGYELKVRSNGAWPIVADGPAGLGRFGYYPVRYPSFTVLYR